MTGRQTLTSIAASALLVGGFALPSQAVTVLVSGTNQINDQPLIDFLENNFQGVTVTYADYSDYAANSAAIEAADLFVVGRSLNSGAYANATNSASFNALTVPVAAFTSYVVRPDSGRWGWHDGAVSGGHDVTGDETTVTAVGATAFGVAAGSVDWFATPAGANFWATGTGSVGDGDILATLGGGILAAHWDAGDLSGTGVAFGSERLLFNLPQNGSATVVPDTAAGQQALIAALEAYTPLTAVPEPASLALVGLGGLMMVVRRKRA